MKIAEVVPTDPYQVQVDNLKKQEKELKVRKARIKSQQAQKAVRNIQQSSTRE